MNAPSLGVKEILFNKARPHLLSLEPRGGRGEPGHRKSIDWLRP